MFIEWGIPMTCLFAERGEPARDDLIAQLATLQAKFANLAAIEQAKGALMVTYGLTADAAFDLLRFHSQTRNVKLRAIAAELVDRLSTSATNSRAVTQFDRLLDDVTRSLQTGPRPVAEPLPEVQRSTCPQIAAERGNTRRADARV